MKVYCHYLILRLPERYRLRSKQSAKASVRPRGYTRITWNKLISKIKLNWLLALVKWVWRFPDWNLFLWGEPEELVGTAVKKAFWVSLYKRQKICRQDCIVDSWELWWRNYLSTTCRDILLFSLKSGVELKVEEQKAGNTTTLEEDVSYNMEFSDQILDSARERGKRNGLYLFAQSTQC